MLTFIVNSQIYRLNSVCNTIKQNFPGCRILKTEYPTHAIHLAETITGSDQTVVAVGGDGTVNEVLNGIMKLNASTRPSLAIYPTGSANDFATAQGISKSKSRLVEADKPEIKSVDVGLIGNGNGYKYFINVADAGFGAEVVKSLKTKRFLGSSFSYFRAITLTFFKYKPVLMEVSSTDFSWRGKAYGVFVANSSQLGSGIKIDPDASIDDGVFTVFIVGELTGIEYLLEINRLKKGKAPSSNKIQSFQTSEVSIKTDTECSIEADGELMGQLPVRITNHHRAVRLRYL